MRIALRWFAAVGLLVAVADLVILRDLIAAEPTAADVEFFEKEVRPILFNHCLKCHGETDKVKGGLFLNSRDGLMTGGDSGPAIVPGKPDESLLIEAIRYDFDIKMPPKGKLKDEEIAVLTKWVERGAAWPASANTPNGPNPQEQFDLEARMRHWSFQPIREQAVPAVQNGDWPRTPVDRFILAKLEEKNLTPASPADRYTLLRRVTYDLIGLPPTPAEIADFIADQSPNAYEKVIDRLLDSPHYGERWGRHWLDLVRFAETGGHEFDFEIPHASVYRDYVIRALNADVPYDQFVREHVAGDLLQEPRRNPEFGFNESIIGTGFFWLGEGKHSPVDIREEEATRMDNQIDVFSKTFLGLTVSCARCHDHKFDAILTADYYALAGYLQSSRYQEAFIDDPEPLRKQLAELRQIKGEQAALSVKSLTAQPELLEERLKSLLLAAAEARHLIENPALLEAREAGLKPDILLEDFEGESYMGWTTTGTAFGDRPNRLPLLNYQGEISSLGKGLVNTHSAFIGKERVVGDRATGTLTSDPFEINRNWIRFLVGGGAHKDKTCVNLKIDGKVVRTVTGQDNNRMAWTEFDVREFVGKQARIEVVDQVTGGWGNIGIDQITLTDAESPAQRAATIAGKKHNVPAAAVAALADRLKQALRDPADSLHPLAVLSQTSNPDFATKRDQMRESLAKSQSGGDSPPVLYADFAGSDYGNWTTTGEAFGPGPVTDEALLREALAGTPSLSESGVAFSGMDTPKLRGVLRSPTFTIDSNMIWFRMFGKDCQVRLIIDEFHIIRNPIYGGLEIKPAQPERLEWQAINVKMWRGHRAYIEVVDNGDGVIGVDRVAFSDNGPPAITLGDDARALLSIPASSWDEFAAAIAKATTARVLNVQHAGNSAGDRKAGPNDTVVTNILLELLPRAVPATDAQQIATLQQRRDAIIAAIVPPRRAIGMIDGTPENEAIFIRGSHKNLGDVVERRFLKSLGGEQDHPPENGSGRLQLAERMLSGTDPLLPRVIVNRVWQHHFGEGIVRSPDDFGAMGQAPTHPELLDFLAVEFMQDGWSLKRLHRRLLLSKTYQMSSAADPAQTEIDPQNKLLHHMPIRRLEAEIVRDALLAVSGRLSPAMYGPGTLPNLTEFMIGRGRPGSGPLDGDGRRSIYINVRRNFLTPMFLAFDYPIPFTTIGRRSVSNVPAQALTLMNNPLVIQQAELWAKRTLAEPDRSRADRVQDLYLTAYGRPPTADELTESLEFLDVQSAQYEKGNELAAWTDLCHVMINVKEFIFIR